MTYWTWWQRIGGYCGAESGRASDGQLEARRPHTVGGLARSINRKAYRAGLPRYKD